MEEIYLDSKATKRTNYDNQVAIYALGGNDTVINEGNQVLVDGGADNDKLTNEGNEVTLFGGAGKDTLTSNGHDVVIDGGADADKISLGADAEKTTIIGGAGADTIYLNDNTHLVQYAAGDGNDLIQGLIKGDSVQVTSGAINATAVSGSNVLLTVGSNKITLKGIKGESFYIKDNTFIMGDIPSPTIEGTEKGDKLNNADQNAKIIAKGGADTITNSGNHVSISAGAGNDKVTDSGSENIIRGEAGKDTITAKGSNILIDGGADDDRISLGADVANATVIGGTANDMIYLNDNAQLIQYAAGDGIDTIQGFSVGDSVQVTAGTIRTSVQSGSNITFYIGEGTKNAVVIRNPDNQTFKIKDNIISVNDTVPVTINGTSKADKLVNEDADVINALAGNDNIVNTGDQVIIYGGAGDDKISIGGDSTNNTIYGGTNNDTIYSNGESNLIRYANGDGKDVIVGFSEKDSLQLTSGSVKASAKSGADFVFTVGSGTIKFKGLGDEKFQVEDGIITFTPPDTDSDVIELTKNDDKYVIESNDVSVSGYAGKDTITNTANNAYIDAGDGNDQISLSAESGNNTLVGGKGNDKIYTNGNGNLIQFASSDGKDTIFGFGGDDSIQITSGNVSKSVKSGSDMVFAVGSSSITVKDGASMNLQIADNVISSVDVPTPITLTKNADKYAIETNGASVYGAAGNDIITNTANDAYIDGGANNDKISLGAESGNNTLVGGAGADTIYTNGDGNLIQYAAGDGKDIIYGFSGDDSIQLTSGVITNYLWDLDNGNMIVTVGSGTSNVIRIDGYANRYLKITKGSNLIVANETLEPDKIITLTKKADNYVNTDNGATINALAGNDSITNSGASAYFDLGDGTDRMVNTADEVSIYGGKGADVISLGADAENTTIVGGADDDKIYTNGKKTLIQYASGDGKDTIFGFGEDDSIQITSGEISKSVKSGANMVFAVGKSSITVKDGASMNFEIKDDVIALKDGPVAKTLSSGADTYSNADADATIYAVKGNDTITNSGASSFIYGGEGADKLVNSADEVALFGEAGKDIINSAGKSVFIDGGADADKISLSSDAEEATIVGGKGDDTIYLNGNSNVVQYASGDGKDVIVGFGEKDSIQITSGSVSKSVKSGDNMVFAIGSSSITVKDGASMNLQIVDNVIATLEGPVAKTLSSGVDKYNNTDAAATIYAVAGNDVITNTGEAAYIDLGDGSDKLTNESANEVTVIGGKGKDTIETGGNDGYIDGGAEADNITLSGTATNNTIVGGKGDDKIYSNANGNIFVYEDGDGKDVIYGFGGADSLKIDSDFNSVKSGSNLIVTVGSGAVTLAGLADSKFSVKDGVITVSSGPVPIVGTEKADTITNEDDEATIKALGGDDVIENSGKSVFIYGGAGADKITNTGNEVAISGEAGNDTIETEGNSIFVDGGAGADVISLGSDVENATVIGGAGDDKIYGNSNAVLYQYAAGDGKDIIYGFTTNDTLQLTSGSISSVTSDGNNAILKIGSSLVTLGGAGADVINVWVDGSITQINPDIVLPEGVSLNAAGTTMTVDTKFKGTTINVPKWTGTDEVIRINASVLSAGVEIIGNGIDNSIVGGKGNDTLYGGDGADILTGGNGNDVFVYSKDDDVITDYTAGKDTIMMAEDVEISGSYIDEKNLIIETNQGELTIKNGKGKTLTIVDYEGNEIGSEIDSEISYLIEDDNLITNDAKIDSITEITDTNYSVGKVEDAANYGKLTNDTLSTVYAYSDKK
ncbi:MAG: hypothetical protein IKZ58_09305 [Selenomonadaceae bacterium]|nr:hypothetical protein [Selenomonadaceae bacterium]